MYTPLKQILQRHEIPHNEEQHPRGLVMCIPIKTDNAEQLSALHRKIENALKELETSVVAKTRKPPTTTKQPWWSRLWKKIEPEPAATLMAPSKTNEVEAIKASMQGGLQVSARERVRQNLEKLARAVLPEYDVQVGLKSITQGGYVIEASTRLNGG